MIKYISFFTILFLIGCKSDSEKVKPNKQKLASIKMYAFDSLRFGINERERFKIDFSISNTNYRVQEAHSHRGKMNYYMIATDSLYKTEKECVKILNQLKDKIAEEENKFSSKYIYSYIEHPSNRKTKLDSMEIESSYKYDENLIGLPYKFIGYTWNLPYKQFEVGYFIKYNKNNTKKANYKVYFKMESKVFKDKTSR